MSIRLHAQKRPVSSVSTVPVRPSMLQRRCTCGDTLRPTAECAACQRKRQLGGALQPKIRINQPGDRFEREADRIADQVMSFPEAGLRRQAYWGKGQPHSKGMLQCQTLPEEGAAQTVVHQALRSPGRPLDTSTRSFMELRFGHDFSKVRIHTNSKASESARAVQARAYTVGQNVVFDAGQYAPQETSGKRLLAHELTHVMQQTNVPKINNPPAQAKRDREQNSHRFAAGELGFGRSPAPPGLLQRQNKPKVGVSGERTGTKDGRDKFSFKAELTVPLTDDLKLGKFSFLEDFKLTGSGGFLGTPLLGASPAETEDAKIQLALTLAKLELESVKKKEEALRKGKISFGTTLSASGGPTFSFDPSDVSNSLKTALTTKLSATTPSLIPSRRGTFTLGASSSATGSLTQTLGPDAKETPKAEANVGLTADFKSAPSRRPALTLGGLLGKEASFTSSLTGNASGSITPEATTGKLGGEFSLGLAGKSGSVERFIKLQVKGDVSINQATGSASTTTRSVFVGLSTGFKF